VSNWIDTPEPLAERQEDRAVESGDLGDIDWDFEPGDAADPGSARWWQLQSTTW
jgi:hypothetical protein